MKRFIFSWWALCLTLSAISIGGYSLAQAPLNPALTGPQFGAQPALPAGASLGGHLIVGGVIPVGTTCTIVAGSTDTAGSCAATATSGVAVTFGTPFVSTPFCVVKDRTTASGDLLTAFTNTGFTMGTTVSADKIQWICLAAPGG